MGWWLLHEAKRISRQLNLLLSLASIVIIGLISLGQPWIHFQVPLAPPGDPGFRTISIDTILFIRCPDVACMHEYDQNACKACPMLTIPGAPLSSLFRGHPHPAFLPPWVGPPSLGLILPPLGWSSPSPWRVLPLPRRVLTASEPSSLSFAHSHLRDTHPHSSHDLSILLSLRNLSIWHQAGSSVPTPPITAQEPVLTDLEVHNSTQKALPQPPFSGAQFQFS